MNGLCQYFTENCISQLLVSSLLQDTPRHILDLGVGNGSLLNAAYNRWREAQFIGVDVDSDNFRRIKYSIPAASLYNINGLDLDLPGRLNLKIGSIDIAVCNPPYLTIDKNSEMNKTLISASLNSSKKLSRLTSDILFLAQNLLMLREGGELGIILPDTLLTGHEFEFLRNDLIHNHNVLGIIQLPDKVFLKTEARTHILLLEKNGMTRDYVPVFYSNQYGQITSKLNVSRDKLIYRMDYAYHKWANKFSNIDSITLSDINVEIRRGTVSKKELENENIYFFHTSSFPCGHNKNVNLVNQPSDKYLNASKGDILLARVGKRCIGKVARVGSGCIPITDCVYRLRVPQKYREIIWQSLQSESGQLWLEAHSHGVCSRVISKQDLKMFPFLSQTKMKDMK